MKLTCGLQVEQSLCIPVSDLSHIWSLIFILQLMHKWMTDLNAKSDPFIV